MKFWQIAVIVAAILSLSVIALRLMPAALSASKDSEWLGVVLFGFIIGPGLITVGIIYGVWKLGGSDDFRY